MKKTILQSLKNNLETLTGNQNYARFVVITSPRTGSNLLMNYLSSHPNVHAHGELFNKITTRSCRYIWSKLFSEKLFFIKAVGFKIFYEHPLASEDREVWDLIKKDKDEKIIHLTRKNPVRSLLSLQIAYKINIWGLTPTMEDIPLIKRKISVDAADFISKLRNTHEHQASIKRNFLEHSLYEITYESPIEEYNRVMDEVFNFLEVSKNDVITDLRKQNSEKISDLIKNYEEFESQLSQTEFNKYP